MREKIEKKLSEIEKAKNVQILYAAESGSRAWGFASAHSDWDIRFIYRHPAEYYLSINPETRALSSEKGETIGPMMEDELDFHGWDIFKASRLLSKSNPPLMEWLFSPIKYAEKTNLAESMREYVKSNYSGKALAFHYLHMAQSTYSKNIKDQDMIIRKKYLYAIRPVVCLEWLAQNSSHPPTEFLQVVGGIRISEEIEKQIRDLHEKKINGCEMGKGPRNQVLDSYVEDSLDKFNKIARSMKANKPGFARIDAIIAETFSEDTA